MNDRDPLDFAVRALRDAGEPPAEDVARTRSRMLETLQRGERRGRRTFWVVLPIAAVLAASTALAKNSEILRRAWDGVATTVDLTSEAKPLVPSARPSAPSATRLAESANLTRDLSPDLPAPPPDESALLPPIAEIAPSSNAPNDVPRGALESPAPSLPARGAAAPRSSRSRGESREIASAPPNRVPELGAPSNTAAATPTPSASAMNEAEAASLALFKKAYQLHFVEHRYAAALVAWDDYLHNVPGGRLTVEARYNRAIALVRLDRRQEAEIALQPFARGEMGNGYRMREARDLLDALRSP